MYDEPHMKVGAASRWCKSQEIWTDMAVPEKIASIKI